MCSSPSRGPSHRRRQQTGGRRHSRRFPNSTRRLGNSVVGLVQHVFLDRFTQDLFLIRPQVLNRGERQIVLLGEDFEIIPPRHLAIFVPYDLAEPRQRGAGPAKRGADGRPRPRCGRLARAHRPAALSAEATWPGRQKWPGLLEGSASALMVLARRHRRKYPAVTPSLRSTVTAKCLFGSSFFDTIGPVLT